MANIILRTLLVNSAVFAILFITMLLVRMLMSKGISAVLQYALWAAVVIKLAVPFGFESSLSPFEPLVAPGNSFAVTEQKSNNTVYAAGGNTNSELIGNTDQNGTAAAEKALFSTGALIKQNTDGEAAESLSWTTLVLIMWAVGALTVGAVRILCAASLKRRVRHSERSVSERVLEIIKSCKSELCLKRRVETIAQSALSTPAAVGAFFPALILPDNIETQTDSQIRHICLHELTHIKYGDPTIIMILGILRSVYWFNPFVWLCFIFIRRDMEAACDSRVLKRLGGGDRREYIETVIQFAVRQDKVRTYAAAGMADERFTMEQRVRSMYRKKRTSPGSRITAAFIALLMLITCAMTACQPTPLKPIVQSKNNEVILNAIQSNAPDNSQSVIHKFTAPQSWQGDTDDNDKKIDIKVDAKVDVPTDTWGIYQLKTVSPDKAYLDTVLKALIGDAKIYGEDTYSSKTELQKEITEINSVLTQLKNKPSSWQQGGSLMPAPTANPGAGPSSDPERTPDSRQTITYYEQQLTQAQQAFASAPDKPVTKRVEIDPNILFEDPASIPASNSNQKAFEFGEQSISAYPETGLTEISGLADIGRTAPARIYLSRPKGGAIEIRFQIGCGDNGGFGSREPLNGKTPEGVAISQSEAEKTAKQKAADMGFGYLDIASADTMSVYNSTFRKDSYCYAFTFTRSLDGVPATYAYGDGVDRGEQYAPSWNVSEVVFGMDDSGLIYADINVPQSDAQQISKGVELKDFNDIMDIFNRQAVIQGCYCDLGSDDELKHLTGKTVNIDEIKLGYMPTALKDHADQIIFVPVWDFFGSEVMQFTGKVGGDFGEVLDKNDQFHYDYGEQSFLTINAIDGTIMQRTGGGG